MIVWTEFPVDSGIGAVRSSPKTLHLSRVLAIKTTHVYFPGRLHTDRISSIVLLVALVIKKTNFSRLYTCCNYKISRKPWYIRCGGVCFACTWVVFNRYQLGDKQCAYTSRAFMQNIHMVKPRWLSQVRPPFGAMMTSSSGKIFRETGPLWGEFTGHRRIPFTKASGAEL